MIGAMYVNTLRSWSVNLSNLDFDVLGALDDRIDVRGYVSQMPYVS